MLNGTPNEFTTFNGVAVPVKDQFLWYEFWGSDGPSRTSRRRWAWAMGTPFKWTKQVASHFGGTAQGMAMSWPGHINDVGGIRRQFHHVIDIVPTILEATGIPAPDTINGIKQRPMDGVSMAYTWDKANANAPSQRTTQYFEMLGNRAIYHDGWVAATTPATLPWELSTKPPPDVITGYKWELYNVEEDPTESNDLAAKMPDKLKQMQDLSMPEAKKHDVLPLDNSSLARWNAPRPNLTAGRTVFTYSGELTGVPTSGAPSILNKSYTITAEVEIPEGRGRHDRHRGRALRRLWPVPEQGRSSESAGASWCSSTTCSISSARRGKGPSWAPASTPSSSTSSPTVRAWARAARACSTWTARKWPGIRMEHTTPITFPEDETFDVGLDTRTGVAMLEYRYDAPFKFTGKINKLTFKLEPEPVAARRTNSFRIANGSPAEGDAMKKGLVLAAVSEAATGVALLIVPSLVGQLLFGDGTDRHGHDRRARDRHRPDRIRGRLLAGHAAGRHVDLQRGRHAVSRLRRPRRRFDRPPALAGGRPARDPDGTSDLGIVSETQSGRQRSR